MPFTHRSQHCDGTSFHCFETLEEAIEHLKSYFSYGIQPIEKHNYVDDFGGTHRFFEIPPNFNEDELILLEDYHTAIECGGDITTLQSSLAREYNEWQHFRSENNCHSKG